MAQDQLNNTMLKTCFHKLIAALLLLICSGGLFAQTRLVLNGGLITISPGTYLVVDNPAANAITHNSGHIISESENSRIWWNIGTTTGTYTVPWGYSTTDYIPLTFTKTAGTGSGHFLFSTYHTGWQNSAQLPTGVANINGGTGVDNSAFVVDRFWQVNAVSYTTKPTLSNLVFTYRDAEHMVANNTITESGLVAKRYNSALSSWTDNIPASTVNTTNNTVTVTSVDVANLLPWWTLGTNGGIRYWVAASASSSNVSANWSLTAGGAGNAGAPTASDVVIFDGTSDANCSLNAALSAFSLAVNAGYSGAIIQGANAITVAHDATFAGGTFTGGSSDITVSGPLTLGGTAFTSTATTLDLKDNLTLSGGSFAHNNGTVRFSGTGGTQSMSGALTATFNHMNVTNVSATPGLTVGSNQNLRGVLTLANNVVVDADGAANTSVFKLLSTTDNPTQDAAIGILPQGAQVTGNVTVQRYMTKEGANNTRIYRYIASPVQNATVADLQAEIPVTGHFTGTSTCTGCNRTPSLAYYSENVITDIDNSNTVDINDGYIPFPVASNAEIFEPGRGYSLFVRGNLLSSTAWDVHGIINSGNIAPVAFPVTFTSSGTLANDGWNLVGNPFPSAIDWNAGGGWTKTNLGGSIYITNNGGSGTQYASWNGTVGTNGGSRYIATGQAFWVKADGAETPVLTADENVKAPGQQTIFFREQAISNLLRITMTKGTTRDEAVIHFREDATELFDAHADALKLTNGTFNLSSLQSNGVKLAINSFPNALCNDEIRLAVENSTAGNYSLEFASYESFPSWVTIALKDSFTGSMFDVRSGGSYSFAVTSNPASLGSNRFRVVFGRQTLNPGFEVSAPAVCQNVDASFQIEHAQPGVEYVATMGNNLLSLPVVGNDSTVLLVVPADRLSVGSNKVTVRSTWAGCSIAAITKEVEVMVEQKFEITSTAAGKACREGIITLQAQGAEDGCIYNWYESGSGMPLEGQHASLFITPFLTKSKTYYASVANSLGCEGTRVPVQAEVVHFDDAVILAVGDSLVSNFAQGNQWYFNNKLIPAATDQSIKPVEAGIYTVSVTVNDCVTTADHEFSITATEKREGQIIKVFPNPVVRGFTVSLSRTFAGVETVRVINSLGVVIGTVVLRSAGDVRTGYFDMTQFPAGLYVVQPVGTGRPAEIKLIKE